jgi:hypothetical protein
MAALGFGMVKQSTIGVAYTVAQRLLVVIHTLKCRTMVSPMFRHEVSKVFCCPGGRAAVFSWYHHHCWSSGHIAYSTGYIVILSALKRYLVLCSINTVGIPIGSFSLSSPVCKSTAVFWVCRHAQVIGTSSLLVVWTPSSDTRVYHFGASYL